MDATNAFETLTDLIDANKDKMPDYDYMKMMDCMKMMFETNKRTPSPNEAKLTLRNQKLTERFYEIYTARSRCSSCGDSGHNTAKCMYNSAIINFVGDDEINAFSFAVYIEKNWFSDSTKGIYDVVNFNIIGFISKTELEEEEDVEYIRSIINGEFYYYYKQSLDNLLLTDVGTSRAMITGLRTTMVNRKNKYFDK